MNKESVERLIKSLQEEKLQSQQRRSTYNMRKLIFVGSLFALGSIKVPLEINLSFVLYIVPFISICFDLYIWGEDYGIKRIGGFIREHLKDEPEAVWEDWVGKRRDPFATFAVPLLTLLVVVACAGILWEKKANQYFFIIWIFLNLLAIIYLFCYSQRLRKRLLATPGEKESSDNAS